MNVGEQQGHVLYEKNKTRFQVSKQDILTLQGQKKSEKKTLFPHEAPVFNCPIMAFGFVFEYLSTLNTIFLYYFRIYPKYCVRKSANTLPRNICRFKSVLSVSLWSLSAQLSKLETDLQCMHLYPKIFTLHPPHTHTHPSPLPVTTNCWCIAAKTILSNPKVRHWAYRIFS